MLVQAGIGSVSASGEEWALAARVLIATWRDTGAVGCARKVWAAAAVGVPLAVGRPRSGHSVGAYFDLITDDGRLFYGDSFHLGYFAQGNETLAEALDAHTDLVAALAGAERARDLLDVGCGIGAPAARIAGRHGCRIVGVNISREQVRQAGSFIAERGLSDRVAVGRGDARSLAFPAESFDAVLCLEVAGDICVSELDKAQLVAELYRVLRPGGRVGFSDLAFVRTVSRAEDRQLRSVLYHSAAELVTDWPGLFRSQGFCIEGFQDVIAETLPTWDRVEEVYRERDPEVRRRYGRRLATRTVTGLESVRRILAAHGTFPTFAARKPRAQTV